MNRRSKIRRQYKSELNAAARRFKDHEGISVDGVANWLSCFADEDLELGVKVLRNIAYYPAIEIRRMANELVAMVYRQLRGVSRSKIYFVPIGDLGGGSAILARALHDNHAISKGRIKHLIEIEQIGAQDIEAIVFVDDFSGTGETLAKWWPTVEVLVLPKYAKVVVALLVMNQRARARIQEFANVLVSARELTEEHNVLSPLSGTFQQAEKDSLRAYCAKTGCAPKYLKGYGDCGLLVAFKHLCPNDSLPILWHHSGTWRRLFRRRAI